MAVSVPGSKRQLTSLTATWPPKRIVSARVSSTGCAPVDMAAGHSRAGASADAPPAQGRRTSALVADRQRDILGRDLAHELQQVPLVFLVFLDAELVHRLQRLVVFLAESHDALGRFEAHA